MNEQLKKVVCPSCKERTMNGYRQGQFNPNPRSKVTGLNICLECAMQEIWNRVGAEG